MSEDKIEIHIILEGEGVSRGTRLVESLRGVSRVELTPEAFPKASPTPPPKFSARAFSGTVCPECDFAQIEDLKNIGFCEEDASHMPTCSKFRGDFPEVKE